MVLTMNAPCSRALFLQRPQVSPVPLGMRRLLLLAVLFVAGVATVAARADGGAFKRMIEDPTAATMPDQAALIAFDGTTQTLAIQTRFEGDPSEFAWVVPLPSPPQVESCPPSIFKVLPRLFPRRVVTDSAIPPVWIPCLLLTIAIVTIPRTKSPWMRATIYVGLLAIMTVVLLPALGTARSSAGAAGESSLEVRTHLVGDHEVSILEAKRADEVTGWLTSHGFDVSPAAGEAIASYVRDGWCFVASRSVRTRTAASGETITPHPLVFRFQTPSPVYPMRLTGANNTGPLAVMLYVFGSGTAEADGWPVRRSAPLSTRRPEPHDSRPNRFPPVDVSVSFGPLLDLLPPGVTHATCLTRTLRPEQMSKDVAISMVEPRSERAAVYTNDAAAIFGANVAGTFLLGGVLLGAVVASLGVAPQSKRFVLGWVVASAIIGVVIAGTRPQALSPTRPDRDIDHFWSAMRLPSLREQVRSADDVRAIVASLHESGALPGDVTIPPETDGPGGWQLTTTDTAIVMRLVDEFGQEHHLDWPLAR